MQETEKKISQQVIDYLKQCNITYDNEKDVIYINNQPTTEYENKIIIDRILRKYNENITVDDLKKILSGDKSFKIVEETDEIDDELKDLIQSVENDDETPEDSFKLFIKWKQDDAIWNIDKDGIKKSVSECYSNVVGFIEHFPLTRDKIKFNNIRNYVEFNGRQVVDSDYHKIMQQINKYFMPNFSKLRMIKDAVDTVAFNNRYNRWIDYFRTLKYVDDNVDYIDYVIKNVLCCEEQQKYYSLYYETLKIMLLANISRIYNKELKNMPTKYDIVACFCSENGGSGKTTFLERLYDIDNNGSSYCYVVAGDAFEPKDKDFIERTHQSVCVCIDELSMKRAIVTNVKGYISQRDDRFRKSYGYNSEAHMRGFIITATSNNDDILKDYTTDNERRWAIIKVSENENNHLNVNRAFDNGLRDKLWAFVKHMYDTQKFELYFTDEHIRKLEEEIQRDYKASNNEDYNTIVNDLLERNYGFYDEDNIDVDSIVSQYRSGDSFRWCKMHNEEYEMKLSKHRNNEYIMRPEDRKIVYWGKIDRIQKTTLYEIIKKIGLEFTKKSLKAEMRYSKRWDGCKNNTCRIGNKVVKAYWRINHVERNVIDFSSEDNISTLLPF